MRGADLLVKTLARAGVTKIFSLSGNQIMPIYDACIDVGIEIIHTRHEAAAVFMADAYAQFTGRVGIAMVTAAPGASNALGPLFSARQAESPILFLTGDSPLTQDGMGAFQELDQVSMTAPLTKLSFRAKSATGLGGDMAKAIRAALSGRPGPVHVALPFDVVEGKATDAGFPTPLSLLPDVTPASDRDIAAISKALADAKRPLLLGGPALSMTRTGDLLTRLSAATGSPVIAMESPRGLVDPSLGDFATALASADLVVTLGKPINFTLGFGSPNICSEACKWIVVDADAAERDRAYLNLGDRLAHVIAADPKPVAEALVTTEAIDDIHAEWRDEVAGLIGARNYEAAEAAAPGKITSAALCAAVQRRVDGVSPSVVIADGGEFGQWAQAGINATYRVINGPSGAIGGALCYAVAAMKAKPDATVFAMMGDGAFGFHFAEFETAMREDTPFVAIIGNDQCWNAEHQIQLRSYGPDRLIGCRLSGARYDLAVEGLGGHGEFVSDSNDLDPAIERAINSNKPACVNVAIEGMPAPGRPKGAANSRPTLGS